MRIVKATVTTNSEDDEFMRVKVSSPGIWPEESELLSSLNSIYLEKGDIVLIQFETLADVFILGKYSSYDQEYPVEGQVLFSAKKEDKWIIGTLASEQLVVQSSEGYIVEGFFDLIKVTTPNGSILEFKDDYFSAALAGGAKIESTDGDKIHLNNSKGKSLSDICKALADALVQAPTTQGSPSAQNFNPAIITGVNTFKADIDALLQ